MAFVKLDCGILDSTIWLDKPARDIFLTSLLMAVPRQIAEPTPTLLPDEIAPADLEVPPGWYGFVAAAGPGIVARAGLEMSVGMEALGRLCSPDPSSRTPDYDGRRLARVAGGFLILNYHRYREKDHTIMERSKRYRERKRHGGNGVPPVSSNGSNGVAQRLNAVASRSATQAEAEAEAEEDTPSVSPPTTPMGQREQRRDDRERRTGYMTPQEQARLGKNLEPPTPADLLQTNGSGFIAATTGLDYGKTTYLEKIQQLTKRYGHPLPPAALEELKLFEIEQEIRAEADDEV